MNFYRTRLSLLREAGKKSFQRTAVAECREGYSMISASLMHITSSHIDSMDRVSGVIQSLTSPQNTYTA